MSEQIDIWVIVNKRGSILDDTIARTRSESIRRITENFDLNWRYIKRNYGCRCVKAFVTTFEA